MAQLAVARRVAGGITNVQIQTQATQLITTAEQLLIPLAERLDSVDVINAGGLHSQNLSQQASNLMQLVSPPIQHEQTVNRTVYQTVNVPVYQTDQYGQFINYYLYPMPIPHLIPEKQPIYDPALYQELQETHRISEELTALANWLDQTLGIPNAMTKPSLPRWGPVNSEGMGTWMIAEFTPQSSWAVGSQSNTTAAPSPWNIGKLGYRKKTGGASNYYIQAHLLNDHMGGPGLAYNMIPVPADDTNTGSSNINQTHLKYIETQAKNALQGMVNIRTAPDAGRPGSPIAHPITYVRYSVIPVWRGHNYRDGFQKIKYAYLELEYIRDTVGGLWNNDSTWGGWTISQLRQYIQSGQYGLSPDDWNDLQAPVDAIINFNARNTITVDEAIELMKKNAILWQYENQYVPSHIALRLLVLRDHGVNPPIIDDSTENKEIENRITNCLDQPYRET